MNSCTLTDDIDLNGELTIIGSSQDMTALKTITAAAGKRHFEMNGATYKLHLWHVKLTGGDVSMYSSASASGGSILIYTNGGELNLYYSEISGNTATYGGGIAADGDSTTNRNVIVNIYNSIIQNNEAVQSGGGIYLGKAVATIYDTTIDNNPVSYTHLRAHET